MRTIRNAFCLVAAIAAGFCQSPIAYAQDRGATAVGKGTLSIQQVEKLKSQLGNLMQLVKHPENKTPEENANLLRAYLAYLYRYQVNNGVLTDTVKWPATHRLFSGTSACNGTVATCTTPCTSTAIGPSVILTAAHCVTNGTAIMPTGESNVSIACESFPSTGTPSGDATDIALCKPPTPLKGPFERLASSSDAPGSGANVLLLGFGCTQINDPHTQFADLNYGKTTVQVRSITGGVYVLNAGNNNEALCAGDSGGAAYREMDANSRLVFGVNISFRRDSGFLTSILASVTTDAFRTWALSWAARNGVNEICGLENTSGDCRV